MAIFLIYNLVAENYYFEKDFKSSWELSDRSSTLQAKEQYMTQFIEELNNKSNQFTEYDAVFLKTPQNSFDNNLKAVTTLRDRLVDIKGMNESSFEYQTAIQQITAQEQGQADALIGTLRGCYDLKSYPITWAWLCVIYAIITFSLIAIGAYLFSYSRYGLDKAEYD